MTEEPHLLTHGFPVKPSVSASVRLISMEAGARPAGSRGFPFKLGMSPVPGGRGGAAALRQLVVDLMGAPAGLGPFVHTQQNSTAIPALHVSGDFPKVHLGAPRGVGRDHRSGRPAPSAIASSSRRAPRRPCCTLTGSRFRQTPPTHTQPSPRQSGFQVAP